MAPPHDHILTSLQHVGYQITSLPWQTVAPFPMPYIVYLACSCNDPVFGSVHMLEYVLKLGMFSDSYFFLFWLARAFPAGQRYDKHCEDASGTSLFSVIISEKNKLAIKELKDANERGQCSIAIMYGGCEVIMPDLHRALTEEVGLVPTAMEWLTSWSIEKGPRSKYIQPFLNKFPSEKRTAILTSIIFATLVAHISAWLAFGLIGYLVNLILIHFLAYELR